MTCSNCGNKKATHIVHEPTNDGGWIKWCEKCEPHREKPKMTNLSETQLNDKLFSADKFSKGIIPVDRPGELP